MKFGFTFDYYVGFGFDSNRPKMVSVQTFSDENQRAIMDAYNDREDEITIYHKITGETGSFCLPGRIQKYTINFEDKTIEEVHNDNDLAFLGKNTFDLKVFA